MLMHNSKIVFSALMIFLMPYGCGGHGQRIEFNKGEIFYDDSKLKSDVEKLGNYFIKKDYFDGNRKTVKLKKTDNTYEVHFVIKKGIDQDQNTINIMRLMAMDLSKNVFGSSKVDIHLCDDALKTLRVVVY